LLLHDGGGIWKTSPGPSMILMLPIRAGCPADDVRTHDLMGPPGPVSADAAETKTDAAAIADAMTTAARLALFN